jgi:acid phosphatase (class A)
MPFVRTCAFACSLFFALTNASIAAYSLDADFELSAPPRAGSAAERKYFEELRRVQNTRTSADCEFADSQSYMSVESFFGPEIGILSEEEVELLEPLLDEVIETVTTETRPFKIQYARPRPYTTDRSIDPCIHKPKGDQAYPSAHAAVGIVAGNVLESLFPGRAHGIREAGLQIGENRVIGGVHHPSDVKAGRELGEQIWEALETNGPFLRDLAKAKKALGR